MLVKVEKPNCSKENGFVIFDEIWYTMLSHFLVDAPGRKFAKNEIGTILGTVSIVNDEIGTWVSVAKRDKDYDFINHNKILNKNILTYKELTCKTHDKEFKILFNTRAYLMNNSGQTVDIL